MELVERSSRRSSVLCDALTSPGSSPVRCRVPAANVVDVPYYYKKHSGRALGTGLRRVARQVYRVFRRLSNSNVSWAALMIQGIWIAA